MIQELQQFGLTEKEAQVYLASLELGRATADQIAKRANVKRPTTYVQIESLQEKGLISSFEEGKKTYFAPESPENLNRLLERQKKELELTQDELLKKLPDLRRMFESAGERPTVRFFEGKGGIIALREEILKSVSKEVLVMSSTDALSTVFSEKERLDFSLRRVELGIKTHIIYTRNAGKITEDHPQLTERAFVNPERLSLKTDIAIFDQSVGFSVLSGKLFGVQIVSTELSETMRSLFKLLWRDIAEKH